MRKRVMARAERAMVMATKRAMASNGDGDKQDNSSNQDNSGNKDYDNTAATTAAAANKNNNNNNKDDDKDNNDEDEDEDKDGVAAAVGGFPGGGNISGGDCGGVGDGGFSRWRVVVVVGVVVCRTTTAMRNVHNNQLEEGCAAKIPVTEAKLQATTSRRDEKMRGRHNTNASAMTARWRWRQWWQQWQQ